MLPAIPEAHRAMEQMKPQSVIYLFPHWKAPIQLSAVMSKFQRHIGKVSCLPVLRTGFLLFVLITVYEIPAPENGYVH